MSIWNTQEHPQGCGCPRCMAEHPMAHRSQSRASQPDPQVLAALLIKEVERAFPGAVIRSDPWELILRREFERIIREWQGERVKCLPGGAQRGPDTQPDSEPL